jgi:hypothetical protein
VHPCHSHRPGVSAGLSVCDTSHHSSLKLIGPLPVPTQLPASSSYSARRVCCEKLTCTCARRVVAARICLPLQRPALLVPVRPLLPRLISSRYHAGLLSHPVSRLLL